MYRRSTSVLLVPKWSQWTTAAEPPSDHIIGEASVCLATVVLSGRRQIPGDLRRDNSSSRPALSARPATQRV